ncbi:MAG: winged helix-turn-helix domain-containing protein [Acidobacteriia bacterium]|nr:winged helix-turn-helix domain-containing protein [Terriglobia bacterium]
MNGDFKIGEWLVSPALNQISWEGTGTRVEPKAMQVLIYLAENPGVASKDQLISAVWPDVFVSDDVLTGCISALRKVFNDNARRPRVIETIHKSGYRLLLSVEPVNQNGHERPVGESVEVSWWRRALAHRPAVAIGVIALAAVLVSALAWVPSRRHYDSIAVLPFLNATGDSATQYLSDGIAEQIVNDLSKVSTLKVMAWATVSRYRQPQISVHAVGRELGVKAVLTGRLLRQGNRVVLQTELVDVSSGSQLWGQQYDRNMSDILALQEQLSQDIAANLRIRLTGTEQYRILHHYNASPAAYELYLKGRFFWGKRTKQGLQQGIDYFQQAIHVDPNYALAYAGLADCYNLLDDWGETAPRDSFPKARAAAEKAIALDDSLAEAHVSLAMVREAYDWDWVGAEQEFRHAIQLNPNYATAHQWYGLLLATLGRFPEAEAEVRRAQQLDPLSPIINMAVAEVYAWERRYDEAAAKYKKVIELNPSFIGAYGNLADVYEQKHMHVEAVKALQQKWNLNGDPNFAQVLDGTYSRSGFPAVIREELNRELRERGRGQYTNPTGIAEYYAALGDEPHAFQWLQKGYEEHSSGMQYLAVSPGFDPIRSSTQYQYWLIVLGLPTSVKITTRDPNR